MTITLKGFTAEGSGPGIVRVVGSFTTKSDGTPINLRPSKGNFTITRKAAGVYVLHYTQAGLSIISAGAGVGPAAVEGTAGIAPETGSVGSAIISQDYMTTNSNGTAYAADSKQQNLTILCLSTAPALADVYSLGNSGGVAKYRLHFEVYFASSTMNQ